MLCRSCDESSLIIVILTKFILSLLQQNSILSLLRWKPNLWFFFLFLTVILTFWSIKTCFEVIFSESFAIVAAIFLFLFHSMIWRVWYWFDTSNFHSQSFSKLVWLQCTSIFFVAPFMFHLGLQCNGANVYIVCDFCDKM